METVRLMKFEPPVWTEIKLLALAVQKVDSSFHWINHYQVDNAISFCTSYPLDSAIHLLNNRGQVLISVVNTEIFVCNNTAFTRLNVPFE